MRLELTAREKSLQNISFVLQYSTFCPRSVKFLPCVDLQGLHAGRATQRESSHHRHRHRPHRATLGLILRCTKSLLFACWSLVDHLLLYDTTGTRTGKTSLRCLTTVFCMRSQLRLAPSTSSSALTLSFRYALLFCFWNPSDYHRCVRSWKRLM